jgi:surface polysaccharide O-acyltransferase-like enzyme
MVYPKIILRHPYGCLFLFMFVRNLTPLSHMERSLAADIIKTLSIFGVVFIHGSSFACNYEISNILTQAFRFCVPCFILIWAFLLERSLLKKNKEEQYKHLKSRFIHLFKVFIIWSVVYFLMLVNWKEITPLKLITMHFSGSGWAGQYFFIILFQLILFYPLIRWLYGIKILRYASFIGVLLIYSVYYYLHYINSMPIILSKIGERPFIFWLPYVFIGIGLARNEVIRLPLWSCIALFLIPIEAYITGTDSGFPYLYFSILISSIIFCVSLLQSNIPSGKNFLSKSLLYIGSNTMTIFVSNPIIIMGLSLFDLSILQNTFFCESSTGKIIISFTSVIVIMLLGLLLAEIIKKIRLNGTLN